MQTVLEFWFEQLSPKDWFKKSDSVDQLISDTFLSLHTQVVACEKWHWRDKPQGRLAEILVLDQFPRNMFRNTARAFANDSLALVLAQEAVRCGADKALSEQERRFLYMPYMHSESALVHIEAIKLFSETNNLDHEKRHKAIVDRFGRYPHRNEALSRESTPEEIEWMKSNSGF